MTKGAQWWRAMSPEEQVAYKAKMAARRVVREELERQVCELRLQGLGFPDIAKALKRSGTSHIHKVYERAMARIPKASADALRGTQVARLEKLVRHGFKIMEDLDRFGFEKDEHGRSTNIRTLKHKTKDRLAASAEVRAAVEALIKLHGLNAPTQVRHGQAVGAGPVQIGLLSYAQMMEMSDGDVEAALSRAATLVVGESAASPALDVAAGGGAAAASEGASRADGGGTSGGGG